MNKSADTRNSQQIWECYKLEYHNGSTQDWIVDHQRQKDGHKEKISCNNLGQYRCCLVNGLLNDVAPPDVWVPGYRNSTAHALEIGLGFRTHPADKDYFLHGDKDIFSSSLQLLAEQPSYYNLPQPLPKKNPNNTFSLPTVQLFSVAVYMDKGNTTDISIYS